MAQPQQQQYQMAQQRPFSPPQASPSPGAQQPYTHQNKRPRLSPPLPGTSPYSQSPYSMSPSTTGPQSASASPHFSNVQLPQVYNTPYSNGHTTPTLSHPQAQAQPNQYNQSHQSPLSFPTQNQINQQSNLNSYSMSGQQPLGTMGPPLKPLEKPKEDGVDVMDVLGGTGIDLREEEQFSMQFLDTSFTSQLSASQSGTVSSTHSFTQFPPRDKDSFYGAGPANTVSEEARTKSQEEYEQKVADKAWYDAAENLAQSRQKELNGPFLTLLKLRQKVERIAREHHLGLHLDTTKNMGTLRLPTTFTNSSMNVQSLVGPDGMIVTTNGTFLPFDSFLVDQFVLLALSTKYRLRGFVEEAAKLARSRQTGSHGVIPVEWVDAAAPSNTTDASLLVDGGSRAGWESAVSPFSNPLKRRLSTIPNQIQPPLAERAKTPTEPLKMTNEVVLALRKSALKERELEDSRLKKRAAKSQGEPVSRQGSIPGTPGSIAPEFSEKVPTKKELKRKAEAKTNEAAGHAAANVTTAQFLGGAGSIFGKKKKYSWMNSGGSASGANTPGRIMTQGLPGTPVGPVVSAAPERLTSDSARRLGTWREDKEKGNGIQIRDWVAVLESDGREKKALQKAYSTLDFSDPK